MVTTKNHTAETSIIKTSAPASTMLMGEHAVLFGHQAIVCAVAKRINVSLTPREDDIVSITSALQNLQTTLTEIVNEKVASKELSFVLACIQLVKPTQGFELEITSEFSHTVGLGSSASVTASCVYALLIYKNTFDTQQQQAPDVYGNVFDGVLDNVFEIGLDVIHKVQKRGSGSDLVASVYGGMQSYCREPRHITSLLTTTTENRLLIEQNLPQLNLYYCGYKTPTPIVIAQVAKQAEQFPTLYQGLYQQMQQVSLQAETAIMQQDWHALGKLMNIYHGLLDALGVCDAKLAELIYQTRTVDNVLGAKISGSGLGDCIISLSISDEHTALSPIALAGVTPIQVQISQEGLMVH